MAPLSPRPVKGSGRPELPAYVANGVVGLRVRDNPLTAGMALVCGFSGLHPERQIEAAAVAPYPLAADIYVDGVWLSDVPHRLRVISQSYDFETGELTSRLRFQASGTAVNIAVLTFCCRHQPTLAAQEISLTVTQGAELKIRALVDGREISGHLIEQTSKLPGEEGGGIDGSLIWRSAGGLSQCGIALATRVEGQAKREKPTSGDRSLLTAQYALGGRAGATYRLQQIVSLVPSVMHAQPQRHAERMVALGAHSGFRALRQANRAEWRELWKGRILLHGAGQKWQRLADAAFFYMNTSVHVGSPASTSMFGLATWHDYHYYYGHVMWDIETFSIPPLLLLQPDAAKALLNYRTRCLPAAKATAQAFGRNGLQFPWESAPTQGFEASPSPGTAAWHEDHVSLDVALAFLQYADATGDMNFLQDQVWPVISGVCDWIVSRAHKTRKGWEIRRSMGIAERKIESDNEAFTMLSARQVLLGALRVAAQIGRPAGLQWQELAERLVLPLRAGVLVSHDGFRANEEKGATPSPLMAEFPLSASLDANVSAKTREYYLGRAKEYIGSPMLSALYGVWAAQGHDRVRAAGLLEEGYGRFVTGRFLQTLEYRPDKFPEQPQAGPFFANMGGFLMSLLLGFPGLR
ncbi:MAG: glycoside hydrolase family 65 protein, partial [Subtercola sp.]|nr:glycoside hydrolase family 65 protein [Subtercola sp.]